MSTDALRKKWGQTGKSASNCDEKALCPELAVIVLDRRRSSCKTLVLSHCVNLRHDTRHRDDDDDWTTKKTLQLGKLVGCLDDHQARERERKKKKKTHELAVKVSAPGCGNASLQTRPVASTSERVVRACVVKTSWLPATQAGKRRCSMQASPSWASQPAACESSPPTNEATLRRMSQTPMHFPDGDVASESQRLREHCGRTVCQR